MRATRGRGRHGRFAFYQRCSGRLRISFSKIACRRLSGFASAVISKLAAGELSVAVAAVCASVMGPAEPGDPAVSFSRPTRRLNDFWRRCSICLSASEMSSARCSARSVKPRCRYAFRPTRPRSRNRVVVRLAARPWALQPAARGAGLGGFLGGDFKLPSRCWPAPASIGSFQKLFDFLIKLRDLVGGLLSRPKRSLGRLRGAPRRYVRAGACCLCSRPAPCSISKR